MRAVASTIFVCLAYASCGRRVQKQIDLTQATSYREWSLFRQANSALERRCNSHTSRQNSQSMVDLKNLHSSRSGCAIDSIKSLSFFLLAFNPTAVQQVACGGKGDTLAVTESISSLLKSHSAGLSKDSDRQVARLRRGRVAHRAYQDVCCMCDSTSTQKQGEPFLRIPQFKWMTVFAVAADSLALLLVAGILKSCFNIQWLGPSFQVDACAAAHGVALAAAAYGVALASLFLLLSILPVERIFPAAAESARHPDGDRPRDLDEDGIEEEVKNATKTIALFALGGRLVPLRAVAAAALLAAVSAVSEELAFRGCLQVLIASLFSKVPFLLTMSTQLAVVAQALIFGRLHSYTSNLFYILFSGLGGLAFGAAFAVTGNIFVPIVMHFLNNFIVFILLHVQVAKATESEQRALVSSDLPIAKVLRQVF